MKKYIIYCASMLLLLACSKDPVSNPTNPGNGNGGGGNPPTDTVDNSAAKGIVRPIGEFAGYSVSRTIGPQGGKLTFMDSRISIEFPPEALLVPQEIKIAKITNTNLAGLGAAFRITPQQALYKPATITFTYTDHDLLHTFPEALGIAFQDDERKWAAVGGVTIDKQKKTVSIKTRRLGDWSFFESIFLEPNVSFAELGETLPMAVKCYFDVDDKDLLAPLTTAGKNSYIRSGQNDISAKLIAGWELAGPGAIVGNGAHGNYTAPNAYNNQPATVAVRLKLNNGATGLVLAQVFTAQEGIAIKLDNDQWQLMGTTTGFSKDGKQQFSAVADANGYPTSTLTWLGEPTGDKPWSTTVFFEYQRSSNYFFKSFYATAGGSAAPSIGNLNVLRKTKNFLMGTFKLSRFSSQLILESGVEYEEHEAIGVFKVRITI
ncbi:hypothetical protein LX64_01187 [Chitinophaga skermanii]|uniref:ZU5 domain-containing protein n=1 Tax=Chitinophaga skermanii TaxID=331697 RepID=A0A327QXS6_9BACT|nr:hypothetical protein [Chitinophaga skermanii]RAJ08534.1 hypothetical protein LX64_01187 [Chitinophaga skermanii]